MLIKKDEGIEISYGFYECPCCGVTFYGFAGSIHAEGCTETDASHCILHVGPNCDRWNLVKDTNDEVITIDENDKRVSA